MRTKLWLIGVLAILAGCAGTKAAYQGAETLEDTAYVVTEHYAALVKEAADMREAGTLTGNALVQVQGFETRARPLILRLQGLAEAYESVRSAENEQALAAAVGEAAQVLSDFINALKGRPVAQIELNNWTEVFA